MILHVFILVLSFCLPISLLAQNPQWSPAVTPQFSWGDEQSPESTETISSDSIIYSGAEYDTVVFDSVHKVPYRLVEKRGDEMIHNWICPGAIHAPHIYAGVGIYRFDKSGMTDFQIGWYPSYVASEGSHTMWDVYISMERMFFLYRKSKEKKTSLCVDIGYSPGLVTHYHVTEKIRRDKFYGVVAGVTYEGLFNPRNRPVYYYSGENNVTQIKSYYNVSLKTGVARMRCRNVEWLAPWRSTKKHKLLRGSGMSRWTVGVMYFPLQEFNAIVLQGVDDPSIAGSITYETISGYISWEGRTAFISVKREWGVYSNLLFVAPSWNRETDYNFSFCYSWGVYISLDKKNPRWKENLSSSR